jgi:hypothetical protein
MAATAAQLRAWITNRGRPKYGEDRQLYLGPSAATHAAPWDMAAELLAARPVIDAAEHNLVDYLNGPKLDRALLRYRAVIKRLREKRATLKSGRKPVESIDRRRRRGL